MVALNQREIAVAGEAETDGADAGVEIKDFRGGEVGLHGAEGEFVDGEVDLEETVRGVGVGVAENLVAEGREMGARLVVFKEAAFNLKNLANLK